MHPTLTQVPPSPHLVPIPDGFTKSRQATLCPSLAASLAHARPPEPPPITTRSYSYWCSPSLSYDETPAIVAAEEATPPVLEFERGPSSPAVAYGFLAKGVVPPLLLPLLPRRAARPDDKGGSGVSRGGAGTPPPFLRWTFFILTVGGRRTCDIPEGPRVKKTRHQSSKNLKQENVWEHATYLAAEVKSAYNGSRESIVHAVCLGSRTNQTSGSRYSEILVSGERNVSLGRQAPHHENHFRITDMDLPNLTPPHISTSSTPDPTLPRPASLSLSPSLVATFCKPRR